MSFTCSVNEQSCCNELSEVEADEASNMAFFHAYVGAATAFRFG